MDSKWRLVSNSLFALSITFLFSSCQWQDVQNLLREKVRLTREALHNLTAPTTPAPIASGVSPSASPKLAASPSESASEAGRKSKEHAELLAEMYKVIFLREPKDRSIFGSYVDSLNQGATLEGVYNGFVHSADFREVESIPGGVDKMYRPEGMVYFAEELARMVKIVGKPQTYTTFHTQPLPKLNPTEEAIERIYWNQPKLSVFPDSGQKPGDLARIRQYFQKTSFFTLKRVLGDEIQKVITEKSVDRETLAEWYAQFAVDRCALGVQFGVAQRNVCEIDFHREWAKSVAPDRLLWEVLNRIHRLMNHFVIIPEAEQSPSPKTQKEGNP